jgi:hypothetical protein
MEQLMAKFHDAERDGTERKLLDSSVYWFDSNFPVDDDIEACEHFSGIVNAPHLSDLHVFAKFALKVLKNIPATAMVENLFSTVAQSKTKIRGQMGNDFLRGILFGRFEPEHADVSFSSLIDDMRQVLKQPKVLTKTLVGVRGPYAKKARRPKSQGSLAAMLSFDTDPVACIPSTPNVPAANGVIRTIPCAITSAGSSLLRVGNACHLISVITSLAAFSSHSRSLIAQYFDCSSEWCFAKHVGDLITGIHDIEEQKKSGNENWALSTSKATGLMRVIHATESRQHHAKETLHSLIVLQGSVPLQRRLVAYSMSQFRLRSGAHYAKAKPGQNEVSTTTQGHYISYCKAAAGWFNKNDNKLPTQINESTLNELQASLLFYEIVKEKSDNKNNKEEEAEYPIEISSSSDDFILSCRGHHSQ